MVAIVAGAGLGLERTSAWVLGGLGQQGQAALGRGADNVYVNAANGNLVIQRTDEMLIGQGPDDTVTRTFNGQTASGAPWRNNTSRQVTGLTGTVNTSGSTVKLVGWDGSDVTYTYNTTKAAYVASEGPGAHDTLNFSGSTWTWRDGDSRIVETYDNANGGRITSSADTDGQTLAFTYTAGGLLDRVTTQDGGYVSFVYSGTLLTKLVTQYYDPVTQTNKSLTRVYYGYDASDRLISVTVDLTPEDNSTADAKTYVTTYAYDGTSSRVASIGQSDGSRLDVTYTLVGGLYRVATLVQTAATGVTRTTTFAYDTTTRITTITDPLLQASKFTYDTTGRLLKFETPPPVSGGTALATVFTYDTSGNVLTVTLPDGSKTTYVYDTNGNRTSEVDGAGNTITRTFGTNNQVLTETRNLVAAVSGGAAAATPVTTRFAYDSENHLRFVIDAEGGVTEYRYNAAGQQTSAIEYAGNLYDISGLSATTSPSESTLATWVAGISDLSQTKRTDTTYDFRGNIDTVTAYGKVLANGAGDTAATTEISTTTYVYDQFGNLLKRQPSVASTAEVNLYDGLGRLISTTDFAGQTTSYVFEDTASRTVVTLANGLTRTSTYDLAGELISYAESGAGVTTVTTSYRYDAAGRLRIVTDPTTLKTHCLYDAAGRKVAEILADGTITEFGYNKNDQLISTIGYRQKPSAAQLASLVDGSGNPTAVTLASVRPAADPNDRYEWRIYDAAQRLAQTIDGTGATTVNVYDGASRLVSSTQYAQRFDAARLAAFKAAAPTGVQLPMTLDASAPLAVADAITTNLNAPVTFNPRSNDGHNGEGLRITGTGVAAHGTLTINGEATITYQPANNYKGPDSFTYTVTDSQGRTSEATVTVTVYAANEFTGLTPAAVQTYNDGGTGSAYMTHLDANFDGQGVSTLVLEKYPATQPQYTSSYTRPGSVSIGGAGNGGTFWSVTPGQRLGVTVEAKALGAATHATLAVVFYDANWTNLGQVPASPSPVNVGGWTALSQTITAAPANAAYAAIIVDTLASGDQRTQPMFGLALRSPLLVKLDPGQTMQALLPKAGNTSPLASNDLVSTAVGTSITFNPRRNDTDADADRLEVTGTGLAAHGQVTFTAGAITYNPTPGYTGSDTFTYTVSDGRGGTFTATVNVNVYATNEFTGLTLSSVNANYSDGGTGAPFNVTLEPAFEGGADSALVFHKTPINLPVSDAGGTHPGKVSLFGAGSGGQRWAVTPGQRIGAAFEAKALGSTNDVSLSIAFLDASLNTLSTTTAVKVAAGAWARVETTATVPANAAYAILVVEPTATGDQRDAADFGFAIRKPQFVRLQTGQPMSAATGVQPTAPQAANDAIAAFQGGSMTFNPRLNDSFADGEGIRVTAASGATKGTLSISSQAGIIYTPTGGVYTGPDSFTYTITDAAGRTSTATVNVTIYAANEFTGYSTGSVNGGYDTAGTGASFTTAIASNFEGQGYPAYLVQKTPVTPPQYDGTVTRPGAFSLFASGTGATFWSVPAGQNVGVSFETKTLGAVTHASVSVLFMDSSFNILGQSAAVNAAVGDWTQIQTTATAPAGTAYAALVVTPTATGDQSAAPMFGLAIRKAQFVKLAAGQAMPAWQNQVISYAPIGVSDFVVTAVNTTITFDPKVNDVDPDQDRKFNSSVVSGPNGVAVVNADGTISYTPKPGFTGIDTFTYNFNDGRGKAGAGKVTVSVVAAPAPSADDRQTRYFYDAAGRQTGVLDGEGYLTQLRLDAAGQVTETIRFANAAAPGLRVSGTFSQLLASVGTNAGDVHGWTLYDSRGYVRATIDGEGGLTRFHYTALGDLDQTISGQKLDPAALIATPPTLAGLPSAGGGEVLETVAYTRDAFGKVLTETKSLATGSETTIYVYDNVHRLVKETRASGGPDARTFNQEYDVRGRLRRELNGVGSAALAALGGSPTQTQIDNVYATYGTTYVYDDADRLIRRIDPNGVDAAGNRTLFYYDTAGRLTFVINPLGEVVQYGYTSFGEVADATTYGTRIAGATLAGLMGGKAADLGSAVVANAALDSRTHADFDVVGRTTATADALKALTTYSYNAFGELARRVDPINGAVTTETKLVYDRRGLLQSETRDAGTGGLGLATLHAYDAFGREFQTTDAAGRVRRADYDRAGRTMVQTDALGRTQHFSYDGRGSVLSSTDRNGKVTTYAYTAFNRQITVTSPEGIVTTSTYNAHGQTVTVKDGADNLTTWTYDKDGAVDTITDALGAQVDNSYDTAGRLFTTQDARGAVTEYSYDAAGRVLTVTVDKGAAKLNLTTIYEYDAKGQQVNVTSPSGVVTKVDFDKNGRRMTVTANPGGLNIQTTYLYDQRGRVLTVTEAAGTVEQGVTNYLYDGADRLTKTVVDPSNLAITTEYAYDAAGNAVARTDPRGYITRFVYDAENRQIYSVDPLGDVVRTDYDNEGRVTGRFAHANPLYVTGLPLAITASTITSGVTSSGSDQLTSYAYDGDGRLRFMVDAFARPIEYVYDAAGNVIRTIEYAGSIATASSYSYSYVQGQIASLNLAANPANRTTRAVFDAANRQRFVIDAAGQVTALAYDANGNQVKSTRHLTLFTATADQSLAAMQSWATASGGATRVDRTLYDAADRAVFSVDGANYVTEQQLNGAGQVTKQVRYAAAYTVTDATTAATLKGMVSTAGAAETGYAYDSAGRLTDSTDALGTVTHLELDAAGNVTASTVAYGTGDAARTQYSYDALGRKLSETHGAGTADATTTAYVYDKASNLTHVTTADDTAQESTAHKEFDALGRVMVEYDPLTAVANMVRTFQYDAFGNTIAIYDPVSTGYFYYDNLNRQFMQVDPEGYATTTLYGLGDGPIAVTRHATKTTGATATTAPSPPPNVLDAKTTFIRDKLDRVVAIQDAEYNAGGPALNHTETYEYNGLGDRVFVMNKLGGVTANVYDGRGLLIQETLPESALLPDSTLAAPTTINTFAYDSRGNLILKTEASGRPEQRRTNYAYDLNNRLIGTTAGESVTVLHQAGNPPRFDGTETNFPTEVTTYDKRGNVIETIDANLGRTLFYYDDLDRKIAQVDALGGVTTWTYDVRGDAVSTKAYATAITLPITPGGSPPTATGAFRETIYTYDLNHRLSYTQILNVQIGELVNGVYTTWNQTIQAFTTYDNAGNVIRTNDGRGADVFYYHDKLGRKTAQVDQDRYLTTWTYDAEGNVLQETRYATALAAAPTTEVVPTVASTADDRTTVFTYDRNGRRLTEKRLGVLAYKKEAGVHRLQGTGSTNSTISYEYNGLGQVTKRTEATAEFFTYEYDKSGRLLKELAPQFLNYGNTWQQRETTYSYDGLNNVTRTRVGNTMPDSETAHVTTYAYGAGGRLASTTDAEGFTRYFTYDIGGRLQLESYKRKASDGTETWEGTAHLYDALGRQFEEARVKSTASTSGSNPATVDAATPWSWVTGTRQNTTYNTYGEMTVRGLEGGAQEKFDYDNAGRLWRSNAGDGVWRFFMTDAVGNRTLTATTSGSEDLTSIDTIPELLTKLTLGGQVIGAAPVNGMTLQFTAYDGRGHAQVSINPFQENAFNAANPTVIDTAQVSTWKIYNAFGEVVREVHPVAGGIDLNDPVFVRNNVTDYTYNTLGRLTRIKRPSVSYTDGGGIVRTTHDTDYTGDAYYYDQSGRRIGVVDLRGNLTIQMLMAGSGYGDDDAVVVQEYYPDEPAIGGPGGPGGWQTGSSKVYGVNVFGLVRTVKTLDKTGAVFGNVEWRGYDKTDKLIRIDRADGLVEEFAYDGLGQRLKYWTTYDQVDVMPYYFETTRVTTAPETTDYDILGRVTKTLDDTGRVNLYSYEWLTGVTNAGLNVTGGWSKETISNNGAANSAHVHYAGEKTDYFGRIVQRRDMASTSYVYGYNLAGQLISETGTDALGGPRKAFSYSYFNTGRTAKVTDASEGVSFVHTYGYDARGNRLTEKYERGSTVYQDSVAQYDAQNRMTQIQDRNAVGTLIMQVDYTYTAGGDIRKLLTKVAPSTGGALMPDKAQWYAYDSLNRATIVGGELVDIGGGLKEVQRGANGTKIEYDIQSRRTKVTAPTYDYTYNYSIGSGVEGTFTQKAGEGTSTAPRVDTHDQLGRLRTQYERSPDNQFKSLRRINYQGGSSQILNEQWEVRNTDGSLTRKVTTFNYNDGAVYSSSTNEFSVSGTNYWDPSGSLTAMVTDTYQLAWWDGPLQEKITSTRMQSPSWSQTVTETFFTYGKNNHTTVVSGTGRPTATLVTDVWGQVMQRTENSSVKERFFYFNGVKVGGVEGTTSDFDHSYSSVAAQTDATVAPPTYVVRDGDTLMSIARSVWGDDQLWYLIADANGLSLSDALPPGMLLTIPNNVVNTHNRYTTFDPYDANDGLGLGSVQPEELQQVTQVAPKAKKKKGCGTFGKVLMVVVAVAVTALTYGALTGPTTGLLGSIGAGAVAGAAGSLASQVVGVATGVQEKISWKGVAIAAISGAVTGGLGGTNPTASLGTKIIEGAGRAAVGNAITQGVAVATGLQKKFDWAGVAVAGVVGGATAWAGAQSWGKVLDVNGSPIETSGLRPAISVNNALRTGLTGAAGAVAGAAARSLLTGTSFGDNLQAVLPDVIGSTIGNAIGNVAVVKLEDAKLRRQEQLEALETARRHANGDFLKEHLANPGWVDDALPLNGEVGRALVTLPEWRDMSADQMLGGASNLTLLGGDGHDALSATAFGVDAVGEIPSVARVTKGLKLKPGYSAQIDGYNYITPQELIRGLGVDPAVAAERAPYLNDAMYELDLNTPNSQAAFLAQTSVETGLYRKIQDEDYGYSKGRAFKMFPSLEKNPKLVDLLWHGNRLVEPEHYDEFTNYVFADKNRSPKGALGNINEGDGWKYHGRGYIQLTGRESYTRAYKFTGIDFLANPALVNDYRYSARASAAYFKSLKLDTKANQGRFNDISRRVATDAGSYPARLDATNKMLKVLKPVGK